MLHLLLYLQYVFLVCRLPYATHKSCQFPRCVHGKHTWTSRASVVGHRLDFLFLSLIFVSASYFYGTFLCVFFESNSFQVFKIWGDVTEFLKV